MNEETKEKLILGEVIYKAWRKCADDSKTSTFAWTGLTEGYKMAWVRFAHALGAEKKKPD